jgi:hypothetical protein
MQVDRIGDGLWRWTAPHPDWHDDPTSPYGGWDRDVACVYHEAPDGIVLIDPLVPAGEEAERFWHHLDQDVERVGRPPTVVVSVEWHGRSADAVRDRYPGARVLGVSRAASCRLDDLLEDGQLLPGGCRVTVTDAPGAGRMAIVQCACHGLLWLSDLVIGDGAGGLRRPPAAWFDDPGARYWMEHGLPLLVPHLMELPIQHLVPAHGPVVSVDARATLQRALDAPLA